jgi:heme exporter protein B
MRSTWAEQTWAVVRKDVLLEARSRVNLNAMLFFAGMVLLIFSFALGPNPARLQESAGGLLWLAFTFSGILAFGRAYQLESENDAFEGLLLVAEHRSAIYAGKVVGVVTVMVLLEAVIVPVMALLFNLDLWGILAPLALVALLGTIGFSAIGALYGALTMSLRAREVLLPLLVFPVTVPVILGSVQATTQLLTGDRSDLGSWISLLGAFDVIFLTVGMLVFEYAVGE